MNKRDIIAKYAEALIDELESIDKNNGVDVEFGYHCECGDCNCDTVCDGTKPIFEDALYGYLLRRFTEYGIELSYDDVAVIVNMIVDFVKHEG